MTTLSDIAILLIAAFGAGVDELSCGGIVAVWAALSARWVIADLACALRGVTVPEETRRRRLGELECVRHHCERCSGRGKNAPEVCERVQSVDVAYLPPL